MYQCSRTDCRRTATYSVALLVTRQPDSPHDPTPGQYGGGDLCEKHAVAATLVPGVWMRPLPAYADTVR